MMAWLIYDGKNPRYGIPVRIHWDAQIGEIEASIDYDTEVYARTDEQLKKTLDALHRIRNSKVVSGEAFKSLITIELDDKDPSVFWDEFY